MSNFKKHFKMLEQDAAAYAVEKGFFDAGAKISSKEIGDGNINYVFRVEDVDTKKSVIIKHADVQGRGGHDLSTDRNRIEAELLRMEAEYAPGLVPEVYLYDPVMCAIVMEDLRDYENMRYALIERKTFSTFVEDITTFMAETLIRTTDNIIDPLEKKELQKRYVNPMLCAISERLVYSTPYTDCDGTNALHAPNAEFLKKELYEDMSLHLEVAKLKEDFKSKAQALIHGDLHTGSLFVKEGSTMVLDPEFAFYGPIGYDVGNVIANLLFAWANAEVTIGNSEERSAFQHWVEQSIVGVADRFFQKALKILKEETTDVMAKTPGFAEWYMWDVMCDTAGTAGLEVNRRIAGSAKVRDITGIEDAEKRKVAERICVLSAKDFIMNRYKKFQTGSDYIETIHRVAKAVK